MHNPIDKMVFLGFMAGIWVGFGGIAATSVAGGPHLACQSVTRNNLYAIGIPVEIRDQWPVLPKLGLAFFFPFALV
jgi:formate transporter